MQNINNIHNIVDSSKTLGRKIFNYIDRNKNGSISNSEILFYAQRLGICTSFLVNYGENMDVVRKLLFMVNQKDKNLQISQAKFLKYFLETVFNDID